MRLASGGRGFVHALLALALATTAGRAFAQSQASQPPPPPPADTTTQIEQPEAVPPPPADPPPADRFDVASLYDERPSTPGRIMSRWGGFIDDIEGYDEQL